MREDNGRSLSRLDYLCHGVGLAGAGGAEEHLVPLSALDPFNQPGDRVRLVALWLKVRFELELPAALELATLPWRPDFRLRYVDRHSVPPGLSVPPRM